MCYKIVYLIAKLTRARARTWTRSGSRVHAPNYAVNVFGKKHTITKLLGRSNFVPGKCACPGLGGMNKMQGPIFVELVLAEEMDVKHSCLSNCRWLLGQVLGRSESGWLNTGDSPERSLSEEGTFKMEQRTREAVKDNPAREKSRTWKEGACRGQETAITSAEWWTGQEAGGEAVSKGPAPQRFTGSVFGDEICGVKNPTLGAVRLRQGRTCRRYWGGRDRESWVHAGFTYKKVLENIDSHPPRGCHHLVEGEKVLTELSWFLNQCSFDS